METVDITIIGAGVLGLAVASEVSLSSRSVLILEKNHSWGQEASSRNSEVIHAGIYYKPGSLKAESCLEGRTMLYALCQEQNIGCKKIGKIIVAQTSQEEEYLRSLRDNALQNGVKLKLLSQREVADLEPEVTCMSGLLSSETGIIDSHGLMQYFLNKAQAQNADLVCEAEVVGLKKQNGGYLVEINNQGETIHLISRVVINCAGLYADRVAALCGIDPVAAGYEQNYLKGNYFRLSDKYRNTTQHLIYPVPLQNSLGIHTVLDLNGGIRLGPDEEKVETTNYEVDPGKKTAFYESVKKFLPHIEVDDLVPDMAGIRAQLKKPNAGDFKDFIIAHEADKGLEGLINLVGIESPGLTSSMSLARRVANIVDKIL